MKAVRIGTRQSKLALWQAEYILNRLTAAHPDKQFELVYFTTQGDRVLDKPLPEIGGKGLFTLELETALHDGEIDMAVHSLKDLPTQMGFTIGAIPERAVPFDALVSRDSIKLDDLPAGAVIGTSSLRRSAQLLAYRSDLQIKSIRGNVETRIKKAHSTDYTATILAVAGLDRLGFQDVITEILDVNIMLPAPGQGAIAVQCRTDDAEILSLLAPIDHADTRACVTAERAFLQHLEAGCSLPVSAYARLENSILHMTGRVSALNGEQTITVQAEGMVQARGTVQAEGAVRARGTVQTEGAVQTEGMVQARGAVQARGLSPLSPDNESFALGVRLAQEALSQGANELLAVLKNEGMNG